MKGQDGLGGRRFFCINVQRIPSPSAQTDSCSTKKNKQRGDVCDTQNWDDGAGYSYPAICSTSKFPFSERNTIINLGRTTHSPQQIREVNEIW